MGSEILNSEGGIVRMFSIILVVVSVPMTAAVSAGPGYDGLMPAVEVTAARCPYEVRAYVGSVPGVEVTARRYEFEDDAWSGLMPGVEVTGKCAAGALARGSEADAGKMRVVDPFHTVVH